MNDSRIVELEQLLWLAAEDVVMFSHYNEELSEYDNGFYAAIVCNDTFVYASADAEGIAPGQASTVRDFYVRYGWSGVVAWIATVRKIEPLAPLQDLKYMAAMEELRTQ